jgi:hypothetical protein
VRLDDRSRKHFSGVEWTMAQDWFRRMVACLMAACVVAVYLMAVGPGVT